MDSRGNTCRAGLGNCVLTADFLGLSKPAMRLAFEFLFFHAGTRRCTRRVPAERTRAMDGFTIPIPEKIHHAWSTGQAGTTEIPCRCGGTIHWAENGYAPGCRACDKCLRLFMVTDSGADRCLKSCTASHDGTLAGTGEDGKVCLVPDDFFRPAISTGETP